ncbi:hypothetical protein BDN72DRAFT_901185 [Pluteus cervinus]|uniref:Uncharacterized protein n=1 Tax=Pluteus cervinus TaxID=181527 RepID=A0ACD3AGJ4_9AGAR|nr:hypothetical protein BDN72DRAFT_901185 [Pluteus cervinus]
MASIPNSNDASGSWEWSRRVVPDLAFPPATSLSEALPPSNDLADVQYSPPSDETYSALFPDFLSGGPYEFGSFVGDVGLHLNNTEELSPILLPPSTLPIVEFYSGGDVGSSLNRTGDQTEGHSHDSHPAHHGSLPGLGRSLAGDADNGGCAPESQENSEWSCQLTGRGPIDSTFTSDFLPSFVHLQPNPQSAPRYTGKKSESSKKALASAPIHSKKVKNQSLSITKTGTPRKKYVAKPKGQRYPCDIPSCPSTFSREADMKRHIREASRHNPKPQYVCSACGNKFHREDTLLRHTKEACTTREEGGQAAGESSKTEEDNKSVEDHQYLFVHYHTN